MVIVPVKVPTNRAEAVVAKIRVAALPAEAVVAKIRLPLPPVGRDTPQAVTRACLETFKT